VSSVAPDRRLLAAVALWVALAVAAVAVPVLWPVVVGAALLLVAVLARDALLLRRTPRIEIERRFPVRAFEGRACDLEVQLRNRGRLPVLVEVFEEIPVDLCTPEPHWPRVVLPAGEPLTLRYSVTPRIRGDRPLGAVLVLERSPLGLLRRSAIGASDEVLRVYPDATRFLRPEALDPKRVLAAIGVKPARRRGEGMEFESLRDFVPGDDPRRLDWAASARRGRAVVRLYQHERNHSVVIALDASRLMAGRIGERTKLDYAVDASLALSYAAIGAGDRVGMTVFDAEVRGFIPPRRGRADLGQFVEMLRPVQPRLVEADFQALARTLATRQRQRSLLVILTDFVEADAAPFAAPLAVLARRHRVLLIAIRDRVFRELDAGRSGGGEAALGLYRRIVLDDLLREREVALGRLRRRGLQTLDLPPEAITAAMLNRYLAIRYGAER
jgi:uncharacterized protein (DUF58 family)